MFTRLYKRATQSHPQAREAALRHHRGILRTASPAVSCTSIRHQSSSSSSRDNDNSNNSEVEPIAKDDTLGHGSFELQRVDLAHGSFFALHHPVDDLAQYFSTLHPYAPPEPLDMPSMLTPTATAWASHIPAIADPNQAIDKFLQLAQEMEMRLSQGDRSEYIQRRQNRLPAISDTAAPALVPTESTTTATEWPEMSMDGSRQPLENAIISAAPTTLTTESPLEIPAVDKIVSPATTKATGAEQALEAAESILDDPLLTSLNRMHLTSVLRKRRIKMRKHKYKKLRKRTRALRKKLGK
ncbi:hypothetical protein BGZ98_004213 [Dissophora globulifera]|nr:hypothetical protein BGZ98_004213 [Dissophora globulifera]